MLLNQNIQTIIAKIMLLIYIDIIIVKYAVTHITYKLWSISKLSGEATLPFVVLPSSSMGSTLVGKNLLLRSKFFPIRKNPFLEGVFTQENKQAITIVVSLEKMAGKHGHESIRLKDITLVKTVQKAILS